MATKPEVFPKIHWSGGALDWQRFDTPEEAENSAKFLVRRGESYTIVELNGTCERCKLQPYYGCR
jgi:hypothetical protein